MRRVIFSHANFHSTALALGLLLTIGCYDNSENSTQANPQSPAASPETQSLLTEEQVQELTALGYLGFTQETVPADEKVVPVYEPEISAPGYNLVILRELATVQLFDAQGNVVHSWKPPGIRLFSNAEMLENGNLLVNGAATEKSNGHLLLLSWDGEVLFRKRILSHHDSDWMPNGKIAALTKNFRLVPWVSETHEIRDNGIAILDRDGNLLEQKSLTSLMESNSDQFTFQRLPRMDNKGNGVRWGVDLLHANSVEFMKYPELATRDPLYSEENVLVSIRHQDTVAVIDWDEGKLVWAWGQGELSGQHDAQQLPNGNFLIFDNGLKDQASRVIELDPLKRKIVWQYPEKNQKSFFTIANGSNQRLPNGNTLIANSDHGEAFEVTPDGTLAWHFKNPNTNDEGKRSTIVRIKRYPKEWVERLLDAP